MVKICTHIKVTGVRCGSPALRGEQFCYFHQRMVRGVRTPAQARLHPIALIEDEESIQSALMEVINALMRNSIDLKRAALILRALHIAVKNSQRARLTHSRSEAVTEIPDYAQPSGPQPKTEFDFPSTAAPVMTEKEKANREAADFKANWQAGAEATAAQKPEATRILNELLKNNPAHVGNVDDRGRAALQGRVSVEKNAEPSAPRKPPQPAPPPSRKEQKTTAHRASGAS